MKESIPLAIASGGGGLGLGRFVDTSIQHGQAINLSKPGLSGSMYGDRTGGAGGGWGKKSGSVLISESMGQPLLQGGIGGRACYASTDGRGDGGFGGGGGGCKVGGGGGGYTGLQSY